MLDINLINFFKNKKIIAQSKLSDSFNILTAKITLEDNANYVIKKYTKKNKKFNAILSEGNSLKYMNDKFPKLFPEILYLNKDILIMEYIANDNIRGNNYENQLAKLIGSETWSEDELSKQKYDGKRTIPSKEIQPINKDERIGEDLEIGLRSSIENKEDVEKKIKQKEIWQGIIDEVGDILDDL